MIHGWRQRETTKDAVDIHSAPCTSCLMTKQLEFVTKNDEFFLLLKSFAGSLLLDPQFTSGRQMCLARGETKGGKKHTCSTG